MKILQVLNCTSMGGVETYTRDMFAELERRGHRNVVVVSGEMLPGLRVEGRVVHHVPEILDFRRAAGPTIVERVRKLVEGQRPDVAYLHTTMNLALAEWIVRRLPSVYFAHEYGAFCPSGARLLARSGSVCDLDGTPSCRCLLNAYVERCNTRHPWRLLGMYRRGHETHRWVGKADAIACGSNYVASRHAQAGFDPLRIVVLPYPVRIPNADDLVPTPPAGRTILYCGRLVPGKGVRVLLEALRSVRAGWRLKVAGDGPELPALVALVQRLDLGQRVELLGRVSRPVVEQLYREARLLVVPSMWPEPLGMVGPEALAYGRPVVGSLVGGTGEWLLDGVTGLAAPPGDASGLARQINRLLDDADLAERMGRAGRDLVERRFSLEGHVERLVQVLHAAVLRRESAAARTDPVPPAPAGR